MEQNSRLKQKFLDFHESNPHVYELVELFTFQVIDSGYHHYSINSIFERIRWHTNIETNQTDFKLSNNHRAYYARHFMEKNPEYAGFFRTKKLR